MLDVYTNINNDVIITWPTWLRAVTGLGHHRGDLTLCQNLENIAKQSFKILDHSRHKTNALHTMNVNECITMDMAFFCRRITFSSSSPCTAQSTL